MRRPSPFPFTVLVTVPGTVLVTGPDTLSVKMVELPLLVTDKLVEYVEALDKLIEEVNAPGSVLAPVTGPDVPSTDPFSSYCTSCTCSTTETCFEAQCSPLAQPQLHLNSLCFATRDSRRWCVRERQVPCSRYWIAMPNAKRLPFEHSCVCGPCCRAVLGVTSTIILLAQHSCVLKKWRSEGLEDGHKTRLWTYPFNFNKCCARDIVLCCISSRRSSSRKPVFGGPQTEM